NEFGFKPRGCGLWKPFRIGLMEPRFPPIHKLADFFAGQSAWKEGLLFFTQETWGLPTASTPYWRLRSDVSWNFPRFCFCLSEMVRGCMRFAKRRSACLTFVSWITNPEKS